MKIAKRCICCDGARLSRTPAVLAPFLACRIFGYEPAEITADWGLRDIKSGHAYTMCHSLECADCGMLFLDMRFDDEEMSGLYHGYRDEDYTATRDRLEPGYAERNKHFQAGNRYTPMVEQFLAPHLPAAPRVLDHGGDTGRNTPFRGRAEAHHVYDISGLPPIAGAKIVSLEDAKRQTYDLIVSSQVLEHVSAPAWLLREMVALMGDETMIYLEVPHEELIRAATPGAAVGAQKRYWHEHINFYTERSLEALLRGAGLAEVARQSTPVEAGGRRPHIFSVLARRATSARMGIAAE
jgi:hypothetical protein